VNARRIGLIAAVAVAVFALDRITKAAVVALIKSAALDLGPYGIRANAVAPGMVRTRLNFITEDPIAGPDYLRRVPLGRFAEPAEIANAVLFLASDESSFITAAEFLVDGGISGAYVTPV
jgi:NAD(P)-dependent dehydrogenase (short-subunit alcohol dehydrogenase family)